MSYERKIKVVLHGYLKDLYPGELEFTGHTPAEVINGMCKMTKAFDPIPGQERHTVKIVGYSDKESLFTPFGKDVNELHIVPALLGGKSGGFFRILIGAVMIAAAFMMPAAATGFTLFGTGGFLFNAGLSLVLGGLLEMLSPQPKIDQSGNAQADPEASKYLGANQNTVRIGTRIPLMYGRNKHFGHYVSFDVDAKDVDLSATS